MITRIASTFWYSPEELDLIENLRPHDKLTWDAKFKKKVRGLKKGLLELKQKIRTDILANQGEYCCFCGLELGETSSGQIEHIAPKGQYPHYMFIPANLALACHDCNGFSKKGTIDTVLVDTKVYETCQFLIVHPYFDEPSDHFNYLNQGKKIMVQPLTDKGKNSIEIFGLDSLKHAKARGKEYFFQLLPIDVRFEEVIEAIINGPPRVKKI